MLFFQAKWKKSVFKVSLSWMGLLGISLFDPIPCINQSRVILLLSFLFSDYQIIYLDQSSLFQNSSVCLEAWQSGHNCLQASGISDAYSEPVVSAFQFHMRLNTVIIKFAIKLKISEILYIKQIIKYVFKYILFYIKLFKDTL